jgi:hypothetical protein
MTTGFSTTSGPVLREVSSIVIECPISILRSTIYAPPVSSGLVSVNANWWREATGSDGSPSSCCVDENAAGPGTD